MNSIEDFVEFSKLTITSQGDKLAEIMRKDVVSAGTKEKIWYSFNKDTKLWDIQNNDEFYSYLSKYLNILITRINELLEHTECECEQNKQLLKELAKQTGKKIDIKKSSECSCDVSLLKKLFIPD